MNGYQIFSGCLKVDISEQIVLTPRPHNSDMHLVQVGKLEANEPSSGRTTAKQNSNAKLTP